VASGKLVHKPPAREHEAAEPADDGSNGDRAGEEDVQHAKASGDKERAAKVSFVLQERGGGVASEEESCESFAAH